MSPPRKRKTVKADVESFVDFLRETSAPKDIHVEHFIALFSRSYDLDVEERRKRHEMMRELVADITRTVASTPRSRKTRQQAMEKLMLLTSCEMVAVRAEGEPRLVKGAKK